MLNPTVRLQIKSILILFILSYLKLNLRKMLIKSALYTQLLSPFVCEMMFNDGLNALMEKTEVNMC